MKMFAMAFLLVVATMGGANAQTQDEAVSCDSCEEWNQPVKPFNVFGNTWYVGVKGLSSVLVTGPQGHILLDGGIPQSAPQIMANIRALGFRVEDVKFIVNSHAHWDHAGGIAALQRATGAVVVASASAALVLQSGTNGADDPQFQASPVIHIAKIDKVKVIGEGDVISAGSLGVMAHMTPGHTPGGTTWTWISCEGTRCLNVVFADSLNAYSSGDFRFTGKGSGKDKTPDISASFAASIAKVAALKCDIIISVHPNLTDVMDKAAARTADSNPFIDANSCREYAKEASKLLSKRLAQERGEVVPGAAQDATSHHSH
jgi:metallo-beta-lactamase class B